MPAEYLKLAQKRVETHWPPYKNSEDFGYDFRTWVSPYTKGAHSFDGIAVVLQDWASDDGLTQGLEREVEQVGRAVNRLTNRRLEKLLLNVLGLRIAETSATNVFPFVKPGGMSSGVPQRHMDLTASRFTVHELKMAKPRMILALGRKTHNALRPLPHDSFFGLIRGFSSR